MSDVEGAERERAEREHGRREARSDGPAAGPAPEEDISG